MVSATKAKPVYPGDDRALIAFDLPSGEIYRRLGPPHRRIEDGDDEPGPAEYWAYRYPCGLTVLIVRHLDAPGDYGGTVYADAPEIDHILNHLPLADCISWRLDREVSNFFEEWYGSPRKYSVIRQDDHGTEFEVSSHPTRRAADCIRKNLESFAHKQTYWTRENTP